jgi:hypothetical protein
VGKAGEAIIKKEAHLEERPIDERSIDPTNRPGASQPRGL